MAAFGLWRDEADLERTRNFLSSFDVVWPDATEFAQAYELLTIHYLASRLSIPDRLIAAMALSRSARLYTFSLRHFRVVSGLDAQAPCLRT